MDRALCLSLAIEVQSCKKNSLLGDALVIRLARQVSEPYVSLSLIAYAVLESRINMQIRKPNNFIDLLGDDHTFDGGNIPALRLPKAF